MLTLEDMQALIPARVLETIAGGEDDGLDEPRISRFIAVAASMAEAWLGCTLPDPLPDAAQLHLAQLAAFLLASTELAKDETMRQWETGARTYFGKDGTGQLAGAPVAVAAETPLFDGVVLV